MASKVSKHVNGYWTFSFYNSQKTPKKKDFYYSLDEFSKAQVKEIRDRLNVKYKSGEWSPWEDPVEKDSIRLDEAIEIYSKTLDKELSGKTISYTLNNLDAFTDKFRSRYITNINGDEVSDYINKHENYNTRRTHNYVITRFFDWLSDRGYIDPITIRMVSTDAEKKQQNRQPITSDQLPDLIKAFESIRDEKLTNKYNRHRNIAEVHDKYIQMTKILFYMGLRMGDIVHLRPAWIIDGKLLRIGDLKRWGLKDEYHPKSQLETDPPIAIPKEVRSLLLNRASKYKDFERIFEIKHTTSYQHPFKKAAIKAFGKSFAKNFSPHSLRHSCATYWLNERNVPVQEVQRLMRHADIKTTMKYYHPSTEAHLSAFDK